MSDPTKQTCPVDLRTLIGQKVQRREGAGDGVVQGIRIDQHRQVSIFAWFKSFGVSDGYWLPFEALVFPELKEDKSL